MSHDFCKMPENLLPHQFHLHLDQFNFHLDHQDLISHAVDFVQILVASERHVFDENGSLPQSLAPISNQQRESGTGHEAPCRHASGPPPRPPAAPGRPAQPASPRPGGPAPPGSAIPRCWGSRPRGPERGQRPQGGSTCRSGETFGREEGATAA